MMDDLANFAGGLIIACAVTIFVMVPVGLSVFIVRAAWRLAGGL